jgi:hypothetical protein
VVVAVGFMGKCLRYLSGFKYPQFPEEGEYISLFFYLNFFIIIEPLWPPKPKEFDNA